MALSRFRVKLMARVAIRLAGAANGCTMSTRVDAAESSQLCRGADSDLYRCGAKAANDLDTFIARRPVNCTPVEDQYRRTVATCSVGGADVGEWLVRNGFALDWPQYSKDMTASPGAVKKREGGGTRMTDEKKMVPSVSYCPSLVQAYSDNRHSTSQLTVVSLRPLNPPSHCLRKRDGDQHPAI